MVIMESTELGTFVNENKTASGYGTPVTMKVDRSEVITIDLSKTKELDDITSWLNRFSQEIKNDNDLFVSSVLNTSDKFDVIMKSLLPNGDHL